MDRNLEVSILKVERDHPIPGVKGLKDQLSRLHTKVRQSDEAVEPRKIDDWPPTARDLRCSNEFYQELLKENSNPRLKGNRKGIIVKGKEFYTFPTR